jgi:hypothetical protein
MHGVPPLFAKAISFIDEISPSVKVIALIIAKANQ